MASNKPLMARISEALRITSTVPTVEEREQALAAIERLDAEKLAILQKPLPKREVISMAASQLKDAIAYAEQEIQVQHIPALLSAEPPHRFIDGFDAKRGYQVMLALFGRQLVEALPSAIDRLQYEEGLDSKARARRLAEIESERDRLVTEHERLTDEINERGGGAITAQHLDEVVQRRGREQTQRERDEERRQRQKEVSDSIERRRRGGW